MSVYTKTGSGAVKSGLSFNATDTLEVRQLAGFRIVLVKSSSPLYTRAGKCDTKLLSMTTELAP
jgi:hypothetical protein